MIIRLLFQGTTKNYYTYAEPLVVGRLPHAMGKLYISKLVMPRGPESHIDIALADVALRTETPGDQL